MATTYGSIMLSNGQTVQYTQAANGAVGTACACSISGPTDANTNTYSFRVKSPAAIVDWQTGAIASGAIEIYSNGMPTGATCVLVVANASLSRRVFPKVTLVPGRDYSLRVTTVLPA